MIIRAICFIWRCYGQTADPVDNVANVKELWQWKQPGCSLENKCDKRQAWLLFSYAGLRVHKSDYRALDGYVNMDSSK